MTLTKTQVLILSEILFLIAKRVGVRIGTIEDLRNKFFAEMGDRAK